MPNYIFHVGLPKTATTSLQEIFRSPDDASLIYNPLRIDREIELYFYHYIYQGTFASSGEVLDYHGWNLAHTIARINTAYSDKTVLISTESLTYVPNRLCFRETSEFLLKYFGDYPIKIILLLRFQPDWMLSYYSHMVTGHCLSVSFPEFYRHQSVVQPHFATCNLSDSLLDEFAKLKEWRFSEDSLNYEDMVDTFENNFTKDNVLVYTFEELIRDSNQFCQRMSTLSTDSNFSLKINKLPQLVVADTGLTVYLMCLYFRLLRFIGINPTAELKSRCELDRFAEDQLFVEAIKTLSGYQYPKLVGSRLYRKRLIFCNARSIRNFFLRITQHLPYTKSIYSDAEREKHATYWRGKNRFLRHYIDDPQVRHIYFDNKG